jgi:hypothetical protein
VARGLLFCRRVDNAGKLHFVVVAVDDSLSWVSNASGTWETRTIKAPEANASVALAPVFIDSKGQPRFAYEISGPSPRNFSHAGEIRACP